MLKTVSNGKPLSNGIQIKKDDFLFNFSLEDLYKLNEHILMAQNRESTQADINLICESFDSLILSTAENSFGKTTGKTFNNGNTSSWFTTECKKARKQFHSARYQFKLRKSYEKKERLKMTSNSYKRTLKKSHAKFKHDKVQRLKKMKTTNPRKFWKLLNGEKKDEIETDPQLFFEFFQNVNFDKNCDNEQPYQAPDDATNNINEEINSRITENEIKSTIKKLKKQ